MVKSYAEWLVRWRYLIIFITLVLVAAAASGARFLTFKTQLLEHQVAGAYPGDSGENQGSDR